MGSPLRQPDPVASDLPSPNDTQATKEAKMKNRAAIEVAKKTEILEKRVIDHYTKALGPAALELVQKIIKEEVEKAINEELDKAIDANITSVAKSSEGKVDNAMTENNFSPEDDVSASASASASTSVVGHTEEAKVRVIVDVEMCEDEPGLIATIVQVKSDDAADQSVEAEQGETHGAAVSIAHVDPGCNPHYDARVLNSEGLNSHKYQAAMIEDVVRFRDEHAADPGELCTSCNERGAKFCGKCHFAVYCSKECQSADWRVHKLVCSAFAGHASCENRPSPEHRRVLYFPTFEKTPELQWAVCSKVDDNLLLDIEHPDTKLFKKVAGIPESGNYMYYDFINMVHILGDRRIGHSVLSFHFPVDGGRPDISGLLNRSINALCKPGYLTPRFGPVIFSADARHIGESDTGLGPLDITSRDVTNIVRFLKMNRCSSVADPASYNGEVISGLRINDRKDKLNIAMGVERLFDTTNVPLRPLYTSDSLVAMAFAVGLRWYIRRADFVSIQNDENEWKDAKLLRYLSYVCNFGDPKDTCEHGEDVKLDPVIGYETFTGSVVILHGSGNPVHCTHVLAFNNYLDELIVKKEAPSKAGFKKYWSKFKQETGGWVSNVPSPYKLETASIKDRLGAYSPALVMDTIECRRQSIWATLKVQVIYL